MPIFKITGLWIAAFNLFYCGDMGVFEGSQQPFSALHPKQLEVDTLGTFPGRGSLLQGDVVGCDPGDAAPTDSCHSTFTGWGWVAAGISPAPATARWHTTPQESQPTCSKLEHTSGYLR